MMRLFCNAGLHPLNMFCAGCLTNHRLQRLCTVPLHVTACRIATLKLVAHASKRPGSCNCSAVCHVAASKTLHYLLASADIMHIPQPGAINKFESSRQMNDAVTATLQSGAGLYTVDSDLLISLKPDVIVTQSLCTVCSVDLDLVERLVCKKMSPPPHIIRYTTGQCKKSWCVYVMKLDGISWRHWSMQHMPVSCSILQGFRTTFTPAIHDVHTKRLMSSMFYTAASCSALHECLSK